MLLHAGTLLGLSWFLLLFVASSCHGGGNSSKPEVEVVGAAECLNCTNKSSNNTLHASSSGGIQVAINCKLGNGAVKTLGLGKLDEQGKFKVILPKEALEGGDLKKKSKCFAQICTSPACRVRAGFGSSKIVFTNSKQHGKRTFTTAGKLIYFSPVKCLSDMLPPAPTLDQPKFNLPPLPPIPPLVSSNPTPTTEVFPSTPPPPPFSSEVSPSPQVGSSYGPPTYPTPLVSSPPPVSEVYPPPQTSYGPPSTGVDIPPPPPLVASYAPRVPAAGSLPPPLVSNLPPTYGVFSPPLVSNSPPGSVVFPPPLDQYSRSPPNSEAFPSPPLTRSPPDSMIFPSPPVGFESPPNSEVFPSPLVPDSPPDAELFPPPSPDVL